MSQNSISSQDLQHAQLNKQPKTLLSSTEKKNMRRHFVNDETLYDEDGTDEDEILHEEHEDELQDNLQDDLQDDLQEDLQDELHDEIEVCDDEEDDEAEVDEDDEEMEDDSILGEDVNKRLTSHWSLLGRKGSFNDNKAGIPKEFVGANTSCAEQVSLDSDLTNSLARNKKYLMSDEDLRRIIENQQSIIEKLKTRLNGAKKLELNPIQEGHVRKLVKFELWKRIQFIRHTHVLDGYETDGTIGKFVMDRLNIDCNSREGFWECYKHVVRKTLKQQRNVVHSALRRKFVGEFFFINFIHWYRILSY